MKKGRLVCLLLALAVGLLMMAVNLLGLFEGLEFKSRDLRFRLRGDRAPVSNVVIVAVDEKSIAEMGRWPWPRDIHGRLIDLLTKAGAKVIAFDVLFTEADRDRPEADADLGRAAEKSGRVVFGMFYQLGEDGRPADPLNPVPAIAGKNVRLGMVNIYAEMDGVNRKLPVWVDYEERRTPGLAFAAYSLANGQTPDDMLATAALPVEGPWNEINLNYAGGFKSFAYYSYADVLKGKVSRGEFKDKIVFVGGTATALFDTKAVPNVPVFPGTEIHATALDNMIAGNYLRRVPSGRTYLLVLLFALLCGVILSRMPIRLGTLLIALLAVAYGFVCQWIFVSRFLVLDFVAPAVTICAVYVVILFYRFLSEEREKRWIKGTFSQYLSPKVIEVITADPARLRLGGEEREMTVFFSDLAGFTSISEALKPSELVAVLNEYLTEMSEVILKYDGVVDKYIGDAIMAFWNAPVDQPKHPLLACHSALDQIKLLNVLQQRFAERKLPLIDCRVGINTGAMVVGNMGSKNRFDYTVMGDSVNLASRLEGANKPFHTHIMISEFTYEKVKNDVEARPLDMLRVKGKAIPIHVYELVARKGELSPDQTKAFALYGEGLSFYRDRKFDKALDNFRKVQQVLPNDGPSDVYIQRSQGYIAAPPPKDWDGVFVMTTK